MEFNDIINNIESKEDFIRFVNSLSRDKRERSEEWENKDIASYLDGIGAWTTDMEGYFINMKKEMPKNIDWKFIATLLYIGKIYE